MRAGVLIRGWLSGLFSFFAVTAAFCIALVVAITGPPSWAELRGVGDSFGAVFNQIGAFANQQIEAYNQARERGAPAPQAEPEFEESPPPAPPRMMAEAPIAIDEAPPQSSGGDDLAGGLEDPAPRVAAPVAPPRTIERAPPQAAQPPRLAERAPAPRASERTPQAARPSPPRTLAPPAAAPPVQSVEIAPPVETAERASLTEQLMDAVEALIPTLEVSEDAPKPAIKDAAPLLDPYADEAHDAPGPAPVESRHEEARQRARQWTPQPGDRFPVDERDLERWSRE
jgi:hypothetical protein